MTTAEELDLNGDIYVLVGVDEPKVRIKVSSALLSIASPYFRTLFGTQFKEASDIASNKDVKIEEEDKESFKLLCKILHMQRQPDNTPNSDELLALAILVDKYDCINAMALAARGLFPESLQSQVWADIVKFAIASYLLDQPRLFKLLTEIIINEYNWPVAKFAMLENARGVPMIAWSMLPLAA